MTPDGATLQHARARQVRAPTEVSRPKPVEFEPHVPRSEMCKRQPTQTEVRKSGSRILKYALATLLGVGGLYLLSTASLFVLAVIGVAVAAVLAFLVAVCVYAQNNTLI